MSKSRGKRPGLRARSKNARKTKPRQETLVALKPYRPMAFHTVESGAPEEGQLVLVRLRDNTYRFGMVLLGRFANYEYHNEEFVSFAHPERITHWMQIDPPVPFSTAKAEGETPKAEPPKFDDDEFPPMSEEEAAAHEAAFQVDGEAPAAEDVYV
jgi:hypothetical protein